MNLKLFKLPFFIFVTRQNIVWTTCEVTVCGGWGWAVGRAVPLVLFARVPVQAGWPYPRTHHLASRSGPACGFQLGVSWQLLAFPGPHIEPQWLWPCQLKSTLMLSPWQSELLSKHGMQGGEALSEWWPQVLAPVPLPCCSERNGDDIR